MDRQAPEASGRLRGDPLADRAHTSPHPARRRPVRAVRGRERVCQRSPPPRRCLPPSGRPRMPAVACRGGKRALPAWQRSSNRAHTLLARVFSRLWSALVCAERDIATRTAGCLPSRAPIPARVCRPPVHTTPGGLHPRSPPPCRGQDARSPCALAPERGWAPA